jgi:hypothetical protein
VLQRALLGSHSLGARASAYGTAFWWSTAITGLAIIPALVLLRSERAVRGTARGAAKPAAVTVEAAA